MVRLGRVIANFATSRYRTPTSRDHPEKYWSVHQTLYAVEPRAGCRPPRKLWVSLRRKTISVYHRCGPIPRKPIEQFRDHTVDCGTTREYDSKLQYFFKSRTESPSVANKGEINGSKVSGDNFGLSAVQ